MPATVEITTLRREGISDFASRITADLGVIGFPKEGQGLFKDFLDYLHGTEVSGLVLVQKNSGAVGLDFYVRHNLKNPDIAAHLATETNGEFTARLRNPLEHEGIYTTIIFSSTESERDLTDRLAQKFGIGSSAGVIAACTFER